MQRRIPLAVIGVAALLLTGCASAAAAPPPAPVPDASHTMPDGSVMPGKEHGAYGTEHDGLGGEGEGADEPSAAAEMICAGQVVTAITGILGLENAPPSEPAWDAPVFTCTYEIDGAPLVLSVHDAVLAADGDRHFAALQRGTEGAQTIEGLLGLGLPSFSSDDGVVGFLRDGKTLVVDATGLPGSLGAGGAQTRVEVAYAVASAVLVCWVDHS